MPNQRYQVEDRLRSKADYERVLARQYKARGKYLLVFGCENTLGRPRLGRIVSKRWGNAVVRNRYRRWIREAFRKIKIELPDIDMVVMPVQTIVRFSDVQVELLSLAKKVRKMLSTYVSGSFHQ